MTKMMERTVRQVTVVDGGALVQLSNGQEGFLSSSELLDLTKNGSAHVVPEGWGGE